MKAFRLFDEDSKVRCGWCGLWWWWCGGALEGEGLPADAGERQVERPPPVCGDHRCAGCLAAAAIATVLRSCLLRRMLATC
jgi:hypothetical protein